MTLKKGVILVASSAVAILLLKLSGMWDVPIWFVFFPVILSVGMFILAVVLVALLMGLFMFSEWFSE